MCQGASAVTALVPAIMCGWKCTPTPVIHPESCPAGNHASDPPRTSLPWRPPWGVAARRIPIPAHTRTRPPGSTYQGGRATTDTGPGGRLPGPRASWRTSRPTRSPPGSSRRPGSSWQGAWTRGQGGAASDPPPGDTHPPIGHLGGAAAQTGCGDPWVSSWIPWSSARARLAMARRQSARYVARSATAHRPPSGRATDHIAALSALLEFARTEGCARITGPIERIK